MNSIFATVTKIPKLGDEVRICHTHITRGGRSDVSCMMKREHFWRPITKDEKVNRRETWIQQPEPTDLRITWVKMTADETKTAIAAAIVKTVTEQWSNELFSCKARGPEIVITCNN